MVDESISIISLDDISCNGKNLDKLKEKGNHASHEREIALSKKEKSDGLVQTSIKKSEENSISVVDIPELPINKEDEEKEKST